jgi:hypothetical protein
MSSYQPKSSSLTSSPLFRKAAADPHLIAGYMTGDIQTTPARRGPSPVLERRSLTRLIPRRCRKRLSDEERIERRRRKRMLGGSSALPESLRQYYAEGERAVLCVIAGEVKRQGVCDLSNDEIGDRAGVGRTTVQNTLHESRRLGHLKITERPVRGQKSLTNLVEIASHEWKVWIKRAPSAARSIGYTFKNASASKIIDIDLSKQEACNKESSADPPNRRGSALRTKPLRGKRIPRAGFAGISARARYGAPESEPERPAPEDIEPINGGNPA